MMEIENKLNFSLNTSGSCFFCLKHYRKEDDKSCEAKDLAESSLTTFSLRFLSRYLNLDIGKVLSITKDEGQLACQAEENGYIGIPVCDDCSVWMRQFLNLYKQLDLIKLRLNVCVGNLRDGMVRAEKESSDLSQEGNIFGNQKLFQNLRKETIRKCGSKLKRAYPKVRLSKLQQKVKLEPEVEDGSGPRVVAVNSLITDHDQIPSKFDPDEPEVAPEPEDDPTTENESDSEGFSTYLSVDESASTSMDIKFTKFPDGTYECEYCKKVLNDSTSLIHHVRFHERRKSLMSTCLPCALVFKEPSELRDHYLLHHREIFFSNQRDRKVAPVKFQSLVKETFDKFPFKVLDDNKFECPYCTTENRSEFTFKHDLIAHVISLHKNEFSPVVVTLQEKYVQDQEVVLNPSQLSKASQPTTQAAQDCDPVIKSSYEGATSNDSRNESRTSVEPTHRLGPEEEKLPRLNLKLNITGQCDYCKRNGFSIKQLRNHILKLHRDQIFLKYKAVGETNSEFELRIHRAIGYWFVHVNNNEIAYQKCRICSSTFSNQYGLDGHIIEEHFEKVVEKLMNHKIITTSNSGATQPPQLTYISCPTCGLKLLKKDLRSHLEFHNPPNSSIVSKFTKLAKQIVAENIVEDPLENRKPCTSCELKFPNNEDLHHHNLRHHRDTFFKNHKYSRLPIHKFASLVKEMFENFECKKQHHGNFSCSYCSEEFTSEENVIGHTITLHMDKLVPLVIARQLNYMLVNKIKSVDVEGCTSSHNESVQSVTSTTTNTPVANPDLTKEVNMLPKTEETEAVSYKCSRCPFTFTDPQQIPPHNLLLHREALFENHKDPNLSQEQFKMLVNEIFENLKQDNFNDSRFSCFYCPSTFSSEQGTTVHMLNSHLQNFVSLVKTKQSEYLTSLRSIEGVLKCDFCQMDFEQSYQFRLHLVVVHRTQLFSQFKPKDINESQYELRIKHSIQSYIGHDQEAPSRTKNCLICSKLFSRSSHLEVHIVQLHFDDVSGKLKNCWTTYPSAGINPTLFPCSHCSMTFSDRDYLSSHKIFLHRETFLENHKDFKLTSGMFKELVNRMFTYWKKQIVEYCGLFWCFYCDRKYLSKEAVISHVLDIHVKEVIEKMKKIQENYLQRGSSQVSLNPGSQVPSQSLPTSPALDTIPSAVQNCERLFACLVCALGFREFSDLHAHNALNHKELFFNNYKDDRVSQEEYKCLVDEAFKKVACKRLEDGRLTCSTCNEAGFAGKDEVMCHMLSTHLAQFVPMIMERQARYLLEKRMLEIGNPTQTMAPPLTSSLPVAASPSSLVPPTPQSPQKSHLIVLQNPRPTDSDSSTSTASETASVRLPSQFHRHQVSATASTTSPNSVTPTLQFPESRFILVRKLTPEIIPSICSNSASATTVDVLSSPSSLQKTSVPTSDDQPKHLHQQRKQHFNPEKRMYTVVPKSTLQGLQNPRTGMTELKEKCTNSATAFTTVANQPRNIYEKLTKCKYCLNHFAHEHHLQRHIVTEHRSQPFIHLKSDDINATQFNRLVKQAIQSFIENMTYPITCKKCIICNKPLTDEGWLETHIVRDHFDHVAKKLESLLSIGESHDHEVLLSKEQNDEEKNSTVFTIKPVTGSNGETEYNVEMVESPEEEEMMEGCDSNDKLKLDIVSTKGEESDNKDEIDMMILGF